jgi:fibronectin type 3 domain-containing protein
MKRIITALLCGASVTAAAADAQLYWDHSPSTNVVSYRLSYGLEPTRKTSYTLVGYTNVATITNLIVGKRYYISATAIDKFGIESLPSNELVVDLSRPTPPTNLRLKLVINIEVAP